MHVNYTASCASVQVLSHIAERLKDLHSAGYVHRDIKPGNIMFLPRTKRWTLIDFGCAASTGSHARTDFSLFYVAPEALKASMVGTGGVKATEALDAWSLGVLAIELLTGNSVFDKMRSKDEVCNQPSASLSANGNTVRNTCTFPLQTTMMESGLGCMPMAALCGSHYRTLIVAAQTCLDTRA